MTHLTEAEAEKVGAAERISPEDIKAASHILESLEVWKYTDADPEADRSDALIIAEAIHCAILAERERNKWQPIETAPKEGTTILGGHGAAVFDVLWEADGRETDTGEPGWIDGAMNSHEEYVTYRPTHWMPLPAAPKAEGK